MNLIQLAQRIRSARTDRQLTLEQLAERTGLTKSVLSKFENFRVTPSLGALGNIAEALGVTMSELLDGVDERPSMVVVRRTSVCRSSATGRRRAFATTRWPTSAGTR